MRKGNIWLVDSGCSRHMTGDKNWFSSLTHASRAESVTYGDASTSTIVAKGTVKVTDNFMFKDALVENLKYNLLSVSQMIDGDLDVSFKKNADKVLYASSDLVFEISQFGRVLKADFMLLQMLSLGMKLPCFFKCFFKC